MATQYTSNAANFLSALSGAVDPRTGMYGYNIQIATLAGNAGLGPELPVTLSYSPLKTENTSYGTGITLPVTTYNKNTRTLQLSTGETYRVTETSTQLRVIHAKPVSFRTEVKDDGYRIYYKNGVTEILTAPEKGGNLKVTETILSPVGRKMTLSWEIYGTSKRLTAVRDETTDLLTVAYSDTGGRITFSVWPGSSEAFTVVLTLQNGFLTQAVNQALSLTWLFEYTSDLMTKVTAPTGLIDRVTYNASGHRFPTGGPSTPQPYVSLFRQSGGDGKLLRNIRYQYTDNNFLGYGGSNQASWSEDTDFLYGVLGDYQYGSTEIAMDEQDTDLARVTRTYSNYHLQIREQITRADSGCTYTTETEYYAQRGNNFDDQPPQFQMPKSQTVTLTDTSLPAGAQSRTEVTRMECDENGNLLRQEDPSGRVTLYDYYPATGAGDDCPADPNGFVRFIKTVTTTPPVSDYSDTPEAVARYTYASLEGGGVVQATHASYSGGTLLSVVSTEYDNTAASKERGRVKAITTVQHANGKPYTSRQAFVTVVSGGVMQQTATLTAHDGLTTALSRKQSLLSGLLLSEKDSQGVTTEYTFDAAGRLLTRTTATGTAYESTFSWEYAIETTGPVTIEKDASGAQTRHSFDALGREFRLESFDVDLTQKWFETMAVKYNLLGEVVEKTGRDWLSVDGDASASFVSESRFSYDGWGSTALTASADGVENYLTRDPISLVQTQYSQGGSGKSVQRGASLRNEMDPVTQFPLLSAVYDTSGKLVSERRFVHDGLGRLREEEDERGNVTRYDFDEYGRERTRTLPDGTLIERAYAPHLSGSLETLIRVTGPDTQGKVKSWDIGTREYDGLGRKTTETSGGRTTRFEYDGPSTAPSRMILPSGTTVALTNVAELGDSISKLSAGGINQSFEYDKKSADLLQSKEGNTTDNAVWSKAGYLQSETFIRENGSRSVDYTCTMGGEMTACTDVTGGKTTYGHNEYGLVTRITDASLDVSLEYDALQRLVRQIQKDTDTGNQIVVALDYDDSSREIRCTLTDGGDTLIVTQSWLPNSLLESRITALNGATVREEQYGYDNRNRLISYQTSGSSLPTDAYGIRITAQSWTFDALNNLSVATTTLADGGQDTATFYYRNDADPTQLTELTHSHAAYPADITLEYDAEGRMTKDEVGRTLEYDVLGRLTSVNDGSSSARYGYNARNMLVRQEISDNDDRYLYYRGAELVNEVLTSQKRETRHLKNGNTTLGVSDANTLTLTVPDGNESLQWSHATGQDKGRLHVWSAYGGGEPEDLLPGFTGQRADPLTGSYHLGNGYRAYSPVLMRFTCPDSQSPFGAGGINPYAYCAGDPINHRDPSGHLSWDSIFGIVLGAIGLALAVFTAGASIAAAGGVMAAISSSTVTSLVVGAVGVVSDVTSIVSGALSDADPEASSILGWVSIGTGIVGLASVASVVPTRFRGHAGKVTSRSEMSDLLRTDGVVPTSYRMRVKHYNTIDEVTQELLSKAPDNQWHSVRQPWGRKTPWLKNKTHYVFGADREIGSTDLDPINFFRNRRSITKRKINIISGTHGDWSGTNWVVDQNNITIRDPEYLDSVFYHEDIKTVARIANSGEASFAKRFNVVDSANMTDTEFARYINNKDQHVILAYCFSRNDAALRYYRKLKAVTSYVQSIT